MEFHFWGKLIKPNPFPQNYHKMEFLLEDLLNMCLNNQ